MSTDTSTKEKRLAFMRRMIWWLPALAFAIIAAVLVVLGQALTTAVLWGLATGVIVGGLVVLTYFGYKMMLDRQTT